MNNKAILKGILAGIAGVAAMTLAEKLEQLITKRPNSYVPGKTLRRLFGLPADPVNDWTNWAMHWGQGILLGAVRGMMAQNSIRGPVSSFMFMNLRLVADQTLENSTGVGALPFTWPKDEQIIDLIHKGVYAFVTGAVADSLISQPKSGTDRRKGWTRGEHA